MKKCKKQKKVQNGFTLVELLVAITILGIITAIAIPQLSNLQASNREKKYEIYGDSILTSGKLYTDSYSQDMFGNNSSGCVDIPYSSMKSKNLLKDLKIDDSTCAVTENGLEQTFVRVRKSNNQYTYELNIVCHNKDGNTVYEKKLSTDSCNAGPDLTGPTITAEPNKTAKWVKDELAKVKVIISDDYGLLANISFSYAWSKDSNSASDNEYKSHNFKNKQDINLKSLEKELTTPTTSGSWYLYIKPGNVRDLNGNRTVETFKFGPYQIDKLAPTIITTNNSNSSWTSGQVIIGATAKDMPSTEANSGVSKLTYAIGSGAAEKTDWTSSAVPTVTKTFNTEMNKEIFIYAIDNVGNKSPAISAGFVRIDRTPPTTPVVTVSGSNFTFKSTDSGSGVARFEYRAIGSTGAFIPFAETGKQQITVTNPGSIEVRAVDNVGNVSAVAYTRHCNISGGTLTQDGSKGWICVKSKVSSSCGYSCQKSEDYYIEETCWEEKHSGITGYYTVRCGGGCSGCNDGVCGPPNEGCWGGSTGRAYCSCPRFGTTTTTECSGGYWDTRYYWTTCYKPCQVCPSGFSEYNGTQCYKTAD